MKLTMDQFKEWGREGGRKRAANLSKKRRQEIAKKASEAAAKKRTARKERT